MVDLYHRSESSSGFLIGRVVWLLQLCEVLELVVMEGDLDGAIVTSRSRSDDWMLFTRCGRVSL